jgi:hypothetical protein
LFTPKKVCERRLLFCTFCLFRPHSSYHTLNTIYFIYYTFTHQNRYENGTSVYAFVGRTAGLEGQHHLLVYFSVPSLFVIAVKGPIEDLSGTVGGEMVVRATALAAVPATTTAAAAGSKGGPKGKRADLLVAMGNRTGVWLLPLPAAATAALPRFTLSADSFAAAKAAAAAAVAAGKAGKTAAAATAAAAGDDSSSNATSSSRPFTVALASSGYRDNYLQHLAVLIADLNRQGVSPSVFLQHKYTPPAAAGASVDPGNNLTATTAAVAHEYLSGLSFSHLSAFYYDPKGQENENALKTLRPVHMVKTILKEAPSAPAAVPAEGQASEKEEASPLVILEDSVKVSGR